MPLILFNFKAKITSQTNDDGDINNVEIIVPLKYLCYFWRTLEIPLINCEIDLILTWSANCVIIYTYVANQKSYIYNNRDNSLSSCSYFINSR